MPGTCEQQLLFARGDLLGAQPCRLRLKSFANNVTVSDVLLGRDTDPGSYPGRLSTRPSASRRCIASVIGRKLMSSRSASFLRDNTSPINKSPRRILSRICWYALPASDSPEDLDRKDTIAGFFKSVSLFEWMFFSSQPRSSKGYLVFPPIRVIYHDLHASERKAGATDRGSDQIRPAAMIGVRPNNTKAGRNE